MDRHDSAGAGDVRDGLQNWWEDFTARLRAKDPGAIATAAGGVAVIIFVIWLALPGTGMGGRAPEIPGEISRGPNVEPALDVYFHTADKVIPMDFEDYLLGVVAAEMEPSWPLAALEAQAIIARTFALHRIASAGGVPDRNAHASTSHREFQAYDSERINDRVKEAVNNTRGTVIAYDGKFARTWFHAYSGGQTATPAEGLSVDQEVPYLPPVVDKDLDEAIPDDVRFWTASVPGPTLRQAVQQTAGQDPGTPGTVKVAGWSPSGRAELIEVNGVRVAGNALRTALGAEEFKSTMIREIKNEGGRVTFKGKGYGHGVGLSQWGAKAMADRGATAEDIIKKYYQGTYLVDLWD